MNAQQDREEIIINLGCGFRHYVGAINVDAFEICKPDVVHDLNKFPWPFDDNYADRITAWHLFEHLEDWWGAFGECARILKLGGTLEIHVPDASCTGALAYRDHNHVFFRWSFTETLEPEFRGANAWARVQPMVPLKMIQYMRIPYERYVKWWFPKWLLWFCAEHMVNFIFEQRFTFQKIDISNYESEFTEREGQIKKVKDRGLK